ncbi:transposase [Synechococcus sp. A15-44]|nr:transposase [Synechococcus sp. A15-44]QNI64689.1 transposase [Synechococcus sp. A15-44]
MHTHANARLTQRGRLRLVSQHLNHHRSLAELAAEAGISLRCAYKWLARYRSGGAAALVDRRSGRRSQRRTLDPQQLQQAVEFRHQRLHLRHIARLLAAPFSTVARVLNLLGLGRLRNLEPKPPVQRYEREHPGDLIHIDVKKLARFRKVGHRITGNRRQGRSAGVGYDRVHVAIDDATRLAYVEVLADEQQATAIGFLSRAVAWFNGHGMELPPSDVGQRSRIPLTQLCQGLQSPWPQAHPHQALHAPHQRQSRTVHPDPLQGMGLCDGLPELPGTRQLAAALPLDL